MSLGPDKKFETGMYVVDTAYKIINFNRTMAEMYPEIKEGDICYRAVALRDTPCDICPLKVNNALFYNPIRSEWIYANAAHIDYPGHGECYTVQFQVRQEYEEMLKKELVSQAVLEHMPGGYHRCANADGFPFIYISSSFEEITGWTKAEIEEEFDNLFINMVVPEDIPVCVGIVTKLAEKGYSNAIYRLKRKGGGHTWISDATMRVDIGNETFYQGTLADVTDYVEEMEKQQKELEIAKQLAEESSRAKSRFLFNVSHDIRTPMNAIRGFTHMIGEHPDEPEFVKKNVQKIEKSSGVLMQLLDDVLELARIENGKDSVQLRSEDLLQIINELYSMFTEEMEAAGIRFRIENRLTHTAVLCDELKCTRILMNMLSNAKKFTAAGGEIVFGIIELASDGRRGRYQFYVRDNGLGMSKEFQEHAFEEFEQEKSSTVSGKTGCGLGLAIIKRLVNLMGGSCHLQSELGKGTEISCVLELELSDAAGEHSIQTEEKQMNFCGKRMLFVEDNEFNREIGRYVFEEVGFEVEQAENGALALEKLFQAEPGYYDIVLMDIQMPVLDGYTAAEKIRHCGNPRIAQIPIVAMTANAFLEDKERCLEVGMNGYIGKPFQAEKVIVELAKVFR